jgi:hypothetical protein
MLIKQSRPFNAGFKTADALCETANCLYLLDNRLQYLSGIKQRIDTEIDIVRNVINIKKSKDQDKKNEKS